MVELQAQDSGCILFPINNPEDLNYNAINTFIKDKDNIKIGNKWIDKKLNILIPMAGAGKRFEKAGYTFPKPIIEIQNKPMIQWVYESLNIEGQYIFIIQKNHQKKFNLKKCTKNTSSKL